MFDLYLNVLMDFLMDCCCCRVTFGMGMSFGEGII